MAKRGPGDGNNNIQGRNETAKAKVEEGGVAFSVKALSKTRLEHRKEEAERTASSYPRGSLRDAGNEEEEEVQAIKWAMQVSGENPLAIWRAKHNLTRKELAFLTGLNVNTIEKIEAGYPKSISQRVLLALHKAGVPYGMYSLYLIWRHAASEQIRRKLT